MHVVNRITMIFFLRKDKNNSKLVIFCQKKVSNREPINKNMEKKQKIKGRKMRRGVKIVI